MLSMRKPVMLALSLLGLFDSLYLLYTYTSPSRPMVCIGTGCDAVRASVYSSIWGVPMPAFGALGYTLLAIAIVAGSLFSGRLAKAARYSLLGMTGFGFLLSLYLEYVQAFVIHAYCAWCVTSGLVMTGLFALAVVNIARAAPDPAAAEQIAQARSLFAVGVAALIAAVPAFYALARHGHAVPEASQATSDNLAGRLVRPGSHTTGNPAAPLTIVEFGDFECPMCGRGEAAARAVRTRYAGQVRFVFRQFPLERIHPFARKAAEASECAGAQGKFWEMVEKIYSRQEDLSVAGLERVAAELGLDGQRFGQCLASGAMSGRVSQDVEDGRILGVRATPTFFIGRQRIEGAMSEEQFSQLVAAALANGGVPAAAREDPTAAPVSNAPQEPAAKPAPAPRPAQAATTPAAGLGQFSPAQAGASGVLSTGLQSGIGGGPLGALQAGGGAGCSEADAAKAQPAMIDTQELKRLLAGNTKLLFVDVRPAGEYAAARIPGAINLPVDDIARLWHTLPKDRTIILYEGGRSSGDYCAAGRAAGRTLLEHGFAFSQVKVYQEGLAGWEASGIAGR
jgi:protein-disulfide isomerase/rhodanese-related sulfurtransferase